MANWYGTWRTNYVKLRQDRLQDLKDLFEVEVWEKDGLHATASTDEYGGTPSVYLDDDDPADLPDYLQKYVDSEDDYLSLEDVIHEFLDQDQVIVIMCSGSEKLRYVTGFATAIHSTGESVSINLWDIYAEAQEAFPDCTITEASY